MEDWIDSASDFFYTKNPEPLNDSLIEDYRDGDDVPRIPQNIQPQILSDGLLYHHPPIQPKPTSDGLSAASRSMVHITEIPSTDKRDEDKRQLHLQSEKRRRQKIQSSYKYLESVVVPILGNKKFSRAELLKRTADLVQDMHEKLSSAKH
eukprot:NODE_27_length_39007_cov_1.590650.p26 type:complete len:150 gc:universal NODE_27_length_39007_cov_1.590650:37834-37385(-)